MNIKLSCHTQDTIFIVNTTIHKYNVLCTERWYPHEYFTIHNNCIFFYLCFVKWMNELDIKTSQYAFVTLVDICDVSRNSSWWGCSTHHTPLGGGCGIKASCPPKCFFPAENACAGSVFPKVENFSTLADQKKTVKRVPGSAQNRRSAPRHAAGVCTVV